MESNLNLLRDTTSEIVDATIYKKMIGSLMYLMNTRPNIFFVVNTLSQYMVDPRYVHLIAAKHVLRYLKGTIDYGLKYAVEILKRFGMITTPMASNLKLLSDASSEVVDATMYR